MKDLELLLKNIKNKELLPIYFFHGEEPYFMDVAVKCLENEVLEEDEKAFGQTVVYGKDTTMAEVIASAQQFPMFGSLNLIIVKEAQDLKWNEEEVKALEHYAENPVPTTVLVFAHKHKKLDSRKKVSKILDKKKFLFHSEPVKDWNLAQWISSECRSENLKTDPEIPALLGEYLGNDLSRIANELQKLKMVLKDGEVLNRQLVETHIGISKDFNVFELQKALGQGNAAKAMHIAHYIGKNPKSNPFVMMVGNLYNYFSNLIIYHTMPGQNPSVIAAAMGVNPYFIKEYAEAARHYPLKKATRIISILREIDLKSKGLGANQTDDSELLKELVYKILNVGSLKIQS